MTLLSTRYQKGRSQMAETAPAAQLNDDVKWSITVTTQALTSPAAQTWTSSQLYASSPGPTNLQRVAFRAPMTWG
jgi:hypothetical protein